MVRNMDLSDFRAIRRVLEPDDFALTDGEPDPPPTDLIDQETWEHIMILPGHVAITTTSHQGSRISLLSDLSSEWLFSAGRNGIMNDAMLPIWDNLESCIFNTVHGNYKTALTILRTALETSVTAARCSLASDDKRWKRWRAGDEFKFGQMCEQILQIPAVDAQEQLVAQRLGVGLFKGSGRSRSDSWTASLYRRLCRYSHSRGNTTDASIWNSNGPIYAGEGLKLCYETFLETYALMLLLAKWSRGRMALKPNGKLILKRDSLDQYLAEPFRTLAEDYRSWLWKRTPRSRKAKAT